MFMQISNNAETKFQTHKNTVYTTVIVIRVCACDEFYAPKEIKKKCEV